MGDRLLADLAESGIDLSDAGLVVGTSAGSVVGARLTGGTKLAVLYERQLAPPTGEKPARLSRITFARFGWAMLRSHGRDVEFRRRIGALALAAEKAGRTPPEQSRLEVMGERLAGASWPESELGDHRRRRGVSRVAVVSPDADSRTGIGPNVLDPASWAG